MSTEAAARANAIARAGYSNHPLAREALRLQIEHQIPADDVTSPAGQAIDAMLRHALIDVTPALRRVLHAGDNGHATREPGEDDGAEDRDCVVTVRASDVQDVSIQWDDYPRLARGIFTLYEGPTAQGKSLLQCDAGAMYTRQGHNVIIHADEDSYALTWKPRLRAAGADLANVFLVTATRDRDGRIVPFYLSDDGERLARKVRELQAARLFLDSLVSTMGTRSGRRVDSHNDLAVRQALRPLTDLGCGVSAIRHYKKAKGTDATSAGGGSVAFFAVARVVLAVVPDPQDPGRHLLAISKNNLVPDEDRKSLAYRIVGSDEDPKVPRIEWEGVSDVTADAALEAMAEAETEARGGMKAEAKAFLLETLKEGLPMRSEEVLRLGAARGISERTLWRAKATMSVRARKTAGAWFWYLVKE